MPSHTLADQAADQLSAAGSPEIGPMVKAGLGPAVALERKAVL